MRQQNSWRCNHCGNYFQTHVGVCPHCYSSGSLVMVGYRPRAEVDYTPGVSNARELARMSWQVVEHPGVYERVIIGEGTLLETYGPPGAGKSSWSCRLVDAIPAPVGLVSAEEGLGPTLSARLIRCRIKREDFHVLTRATVDQVVAFIQQHKLVAIIIDSVSDISWSATELRSILEVCPSLKLLVAVLQVTKETQPAGRMALQHEADVMIKFENMKWQITKSRFQPIDETMTDSVLPPDTETPSTNISEKVNENAST